MLTQHQSLVWRIICNRVRESGGVPPTYQEIAAAAGMKSKSGAHAVILALAERGYIRRIPRRQQSIEVLKWPADRQMWFVFDEEAKALRRMD